MFFGEASPFRRTSTFGHAPGAVLESEPRPGGARSWRLGRRSRALGPLDWPGSPEGDTQTGFGNASALTSTARLYFTPPLVLFEVRALQES